MLLQTPHIIKERNYVEFDQEAVMNSVIKNNENGAVLVVALLMLVILSIMGAFAMSISLIEQKVTNNSEVFQHNFYAVEATMLEAAARIEETDDADLLDLAAASVPLAWLKPSDPAIDLKQSSQWPHAMILPSETTLNVLPTDITPAGYTPDGTATGDRIWHAALDIGLCAGASLTDPTREEHCYDVYGMYDIKRGIGKTYTGRMLMTVGYKNVLYRN